MAYSPPHTYVTGDILSADDHVSNEEAAAIFINQGSVTADLALDTFDTDDIQTGELQPITNHYYFLTGEATGLSNGIDATDRAFFTSTIKPGRQTDNTLEIWSTIYETGPDLHLEEAADVIITFGGSFISQDNNIEANGFWDSKVLLRYINDGTITEVNQSRAYSFEETSNSNTVSGNFSPFGATTKPSSTGDEQPEIYTSLRRWIGFTSVLSLAAGTYKFSVYVNAKVQNGFASARTFKTEVFYR